MKKNFKLVLALIVAVLMIAGSISAVADPSPVNNPSAVTPASDAHLPVDSSSYDSSITITGLDNGDIVNFYQIVEWVGSQNGNVKGWKAKDPFDTVLTETVLKKVLLGEGLTGTEVAGITAALAGQLATAADSATAAYTVNPVSGKQAVMNITANTKPGIYMAIVTPVDQDTIYNPVFVSCDFDTTNATNSQVADMAASYSDKASVKKSKTELKKSSTAQDDPWDYSYAAGAVAVGDTVNFTVTTTIPGYAAYEYPKFNVTDKLTDLKLKSNTTVKVYESDGTNAIAASNYEITYDPDMKGYKVVFKPDYLKTIKSPKNVVLKYDAIVTTEALKNVNIEKNEISTEFSNNPADSSDFSVKKDITKHYTFSIDANSLFGEGFQVGESGTEIVKIGRDAKGNIIKSEKTYSHVDSAHYQESPLAGAQFKLYTNAACTEEYIPLQADGSKGTAPLDLKSDSEGRINIPGLDAGVYYLLETKAPDGFVKNNTPVCIDISCDWTTVQNTEYFINGSWSFTPNSSAKPYTYEYQELQTVHIKINGEETTTHTFLHDSKWAEMSWTNLGSKELPSSIVNVQGVELPSTGGIGTTIFYVGGSLMVLAAAILLITKRRMGAED